MIATIYALVASDEPTRFRYIGITVCALNVRLRGHHHDERRRSWRKDHRKSDWMREVISRGAVVQIVALETHGNDDDLFRCESILIEKHRADLLNLSGITTAYRRSGGKRKTARE